MFERKRQRELQEHEARLVKRGQEEYAKQLAPPPLPGESGRPVRRWDSQKAEFLSKQLPRPEAVYLGQVALGRDQLFSEMANGGAAAIRGKRYTDSRVTSDEAERTAEQAPVFEALAAYERAYGKLGLIPAIPPSQELPPVQPPTLLDQHSQQ